MTDYAVSDELALKMMLRATYDAAFQNFHIYAGRHLLLLRTFHQALEC